MGVTAAVVGAGAAAASAGNSIFGSGSATPQGGSATGGYVPQNPGYADATSLSALSQYAGYAGGLPSYAIPQAQAQTQYALNNPYVNQQQGAANDVYNYGLGTAVPAAQQGAASLYGLSALGSSYAPQALANGFDPQSALYNQQYQRNLDQTNAINSMNGVSGTPYGAGLATQSAQNFNTDWQNQQLGRQNTAANTYGALSGTAGAGYTGSLGLATTGMGIAQTAGSAPYQAYAGQVGNNLGSLSTLGSIYGSSLAPLQNQYNIGSSYLGATQSGAVNASNIQGQQGAAAGQSFASLGTNLANLGNAFPSSGNYSANPAIASYSNPYSSYSYNPSLQGLSSQPNFSF